MKSIISAVAILLLIAQFSGIESLLISNILTTYVHSLSNIVEYITTDVEVVSNFLESRNEDRINGLLEDKVLITHFVTSGENLNSILNKYNPDEDISDLRDVAVFYNPDAISSDYSIIANTYIIVPASNN